jgi:hypothetical protein
MSGKRRKSNFPTINKLPCFFFMPDSSSIQSISIQKVRASHRKESGCQIPANYTFRRLFVLCDNKVYCEYKETKGNECQKLSETMYSSNA